MTPSAPARRLRGRALPADSRAVTALARVQQDLAPQGSGLKVSTAGRGARYAFRALGARHQGRKACDFYPDVDKRPVPTGYISTAPAIRAVRPSTSRWCGWRAAGARRSRHGHALRFWRTAGRQRCRAPRRRPTGKSSPPRWRGGFIPYDKEWVALGAARRAAPNSYFDFVVASAPRCRARVARTASLGALSGKTRP